VGIVIAIKWILSGSHNMPTSEKSAVRAPEEKSSAAVELFDLLRDGKYARPERTFRSSVDPQLTQRLAAS
jgi:hypothetical protein